MQTAWMREPVSARGPTPPLVCEVATFPGGGEGGAQQMESDTNILDCASFGSRFADHDGEELARLLTREWGPERTMREIEHFEYVARRLSLLAGMCRLAAQRLRG